MTGTTPPNPSRPVPWKLIRVLVVAAVAAGAAWGVVSLNAFAGGFLLALLFLGLLLSNSTVRRWALTGKIRPPVVHSSPQQIEKI